MTADVLLAYMVATYGPGGEVVVPLDKLRGNRHVIKSVNANGDLVLRVSRIDASEAPQIKGATDLGKSNE